MSLEIHSDPPVTPQDDINNNATAASESPQRPSQKTAKINLTTRAKIVLSTLGGSSVICGVFAALGSLSMIALPTTAIAVLIGAAAALAATTIAYAIISLKQNHTPKTQGTNESTSPKEIQNNTQQLQAENILNEAISAESEILPATNNSPENQVLNDDENSKEQNEETIQSETDTSGTLKEQNETQPIISNESPSELSSSNPVDKVKNASPKEIQNNSQQPQTESELNETKSKTQPATNNSPENQVQNNGENSKEQNEQAATNNTLNKQNTEAIQSETDTSGTLNEQNEAQPTTGNEVSGEFNPSNSVYEIKNESPESNDNKSSSTSPDNVNSADEQSLAEKPEASQNKASDIPVSPKKSAAKPNTKITIIGSHKGLPQSKGLTTNKTYLTKPGKIHSPIGAASNKDSTNIGIVDSLCELGKSYEKPTIVAYESSADASKASNKKASTLYSTHCKSGYLIPIDVLRSRLSNVCKKHSSILTIENGNVFRSTTLNELDALKQKMHQELEQALKQQIEKENILRNLNAMERQRSKFTNDQATSDNPQANATLIKQYKRLKELDALLTFYTSKGSKNYQELQKKLNDIQNSILPTGNDLLTEVEKLSAALKQKSEALG